MKILITGNAGSGKSTLARKIADEQGLPYFGLDQIIWKPKWVKSSNCEVATKISSLISRDHWVIDGVSAQVMTAADVIVFLDVPRRISFWRVAKRNYRYLFKSRPGLPEKCPEILIIPKLTRIIWRFPKRVRPNILAEREKREVAFRHVKSGKDMVKCRDLLLSNLREV